MRIFKRHYLLHILFNGSHANTFIEESPASWIARNRKRNVVLINSWPISAKEYAALKAAGNAEVKPE